jgi:hypothetical protein
LAGISFRTLRALVAERTDCTLRTGNTLRADWSLVALRSLVRDRHRFNDEIGLDHLDVELWTGFDREVEIGAT